MDGPPRVGGAQDATHFLPTSPQSSEHRKDSHVDAERIRFENLAVESLLPAMAEQSADPPPPPVRLLEMVEFSMRVVRKA